MYPSSATSLDATCCLQLSLQSLSLLQDVVQTQGWCLSPALDGSLQEPLGSGPWPLLIPIEHCGHLLLDPQHMGIQQSL